MNITLNRSSNTATSVEFKAAGHNIKVYFSYKTVIAIEMGSNLYISDNIWSNTTGKHLNDIDPDKSKRLPRAEFEKILDRIYFNFGME